MPIVTAKKEYLKTDIPEFSAGDVVRVHQKIKEGEKTRIQIFEGVVIARRGGKGINATFTVRRIASGVGVERIFPLHSPNIAKIEVSRPGRVRTAKIYYVRGRAGNEPRYKKGSKRSHNAKKTS